MGFLQRLLAVAQPEAEELPFEPLVRRRRIRSGEQCSFSMPSVSRHTIRRVQPLNWNDIHLLVDYLRQDDISVFRLAFPAPDLSARMLDFLCGAALIQRAGLYRIASETYLFTPAGVVVDEAFLRQLEAAGVYTRDSQIQRQRLA